MPEAPDVLLTRSSDVVRAFYAAINAADPETLGALIDELFDEDAAVEFPPSLPYGGRVESARRLRRMFTAMAGGDAGIGPRTIRVDQVVAAPDIAVAVLSFDWFAAGSAEPVPSGACETWTFRDDKVVEIRAYYWDTAALLA